MLLLQRCDITHLHTSPHHPQSNGLVERMNGTIKESMKRDVNSQQNNWDQTMPLTLLGIRASRQATIKMSPSEVLLGHKIRLPVVAEAMLREDTINHYHAIRNMHLVDAPDGGAAQQRAVLAHINHMEHVETVALRNIDRAADRVREYITRQAANQKTLNPPRIGDLILRPLQGRAYPTLGK